MLSAAATERVSEKGRKRRRYRLEDIVQELGEWWLAGWRLTHCSREEKKRSSALIEVRPPVDSRLEEREREEK